MNRILLFSQSLSQHPVSKASLLFGEAFQKRRIEVERLRVVPETGDILIFNRLNKSTYPVSEGVFRTKYEPVPGDEPNLYQTRSALPDVRDIILPIPSGNGKYQADGKKYGKTIRYDSTVFQTKDVALVRNPDNPQKRYPIPLYYLLGAYMPVDEAAQKMMKEVYSRLNIKGPIKNPQDMKGHANNYFHGRPYRLMTAGYTDAPEGYERSTRELLSKVVANLDPGKVGLITSPTADENSIDAITTIVAQGASQTVPILYLTVEKYLKYVQPARFPEVIDLESFNRQDKYFFDSMAHYSEASATAGSATLILGGRNISVEDAINALQRGKPVVLVDQLALNKGPWNVAQNRADNASRYLYEQIQAYLAGRDLPHSPTKSSDGKETYDKAFLTALDQQLKGKGGLASMVHYIRVENDSPYELDAKARQIADFLQAKIRK